MAHQQFHIIVTGESGRGRALTIKKATIRSLVLIGVLFAALIIFSGISFYQLHLFSVDLKEHVAYLESQPDPTCQINSLKQIIKDKERLVTDYQEKIETLKARHKEQHQKTISRLDKRARMIKAVMDKIGVKVAVEDDPRHSGGPFVEAKEFQAGEALLESTDRYLHLLKTIPLGKPVSGPVSSIFGPRRDPINHKASYHEGLDFRGKRGDKIIATAKGIVQKIHCGKGYGKCVLIKHNDDFSTLFAHLSKREVKVGEKIERGQVIGRVGNTGRSTGPHLHYEVRHKGKPVDPMNFVAIANTSIMRSSR